MFKRTRYTFGRITPKGVRRLSAIYKDPSLKRGRGCLCEDGGYSTHCCDGSIQGQGIGDVGFCGNYVVEDYWACGYTE